MTNKRPLAIYDGIIGEIKYGDTIVADLIPANVSPISSMEGVEVVLSTQGNGTNTFILSKSVLKVLVAVDGILQSDYIQPDGTNILTLGFIPENSEYVTAYSFSIATSIPSIYEVLSTTTDGTTNSYTLNSVVEGLLIFIDGILQYDFSHSNGTSSVVLNFTPIAGKRLVGYAVVGNGSSATGGTSTASYYEHLQAVSLDVQYIEHNLNKYPTVVIVDSSGDNEEVWGDVKYLDQNRIQISFSSAFSGSAYLT